MQVVVTYVADSHGIEGGRESCKLRSTTTVVIVVERWDLIARLYSTLAS